MEFKRSTFDIVDKIKFNKIIVHLNNNSEKICIYIYFFIIQRVKARVIP